MLRWFAAEIELQIRPSHHTTMQASHTLAARSRKGGLKRIDFLPRKRDNGSIFCPGTRGATTSDTLCPAAWGRLDYSDVIRVESNDAKTDRSPRPCCPMWWPSWLRGSFGYRTWRTGFIGLRGRCEGGGFKNQIAPRVVQEHEISIDFTSTMVTSTYRVQLAQ